MVAAIAAQQGAQMAGQAAKTITRALGQPLISYRRVSSTKRGRRLYPEGFAISIPAWVPMSMVGLYALKRGIEEGYPQVGFGWLTGWGVASAAAEFVEDIGEEITEAGEEAAAEADEEITEVLEETGVVEHKEYGEKFYQATDGWYYYYSQSEVNLYRNRVTGEIPPLAGRGRYYYDGSPDLDNEGNHIDRDGNPIIYA